MARKVFYSFHHKPDSWRASKVRNIGVVEGNQSATDNDWETVKGGGEKSIQKWIDDQLHGRSCTIVLIGAETADRKWIKYEIKKSWNDGKGLLGIHIHNILDSEGRASAKGVNPFDQFTMDRDGTRLSTLAKVYSPPYYDSKDVYAYISNNLSTWIEDAIKVRSNY